jgi:hypothetical protein
VGSDIRLNRWRLVLGPDAQGPLDASLGASSLRLDAALETLYGANRRGNLARSSPAVTRWLAEIRACFPRSAVQVLQRDAIDRLDLARLLLEPELLESLQPDIHLVATLLTLKAALPARARDAARRLVAQLVREFQERLDLPARQAIRGALSRAARTSRPRHGEIDWDRTILANLHHYQPQLGTVIPERLIGYARRRSGLRDVVLCVDQSGSMAPSVIYASLFASVLASIPALNTRLAVFDTAIADLTDHLDDPVSLLFAAQLGGGTDIAQALAWCQQVIARPTQTHLVLVSDLFDGGERTHLLQRAAALVRSGVSMVCLLALDDQGTPTFDAETASRMAGLGVPTFGCTPDAFPELMAAALTGRDLGCWAAAHGLHGIRPTR